MTALRPQLAMELWVLRPYARQFVLVPLIALGLGFLQDTVVPVMVVMAVLTGSYGFAVTETSRLETLFATLPTSRRTVVLARYLVTTGVLVAVGLFAVALDGLSAAIRQQQWDPTVSAMVLGASLALAGLVIAVQFPFYFRLGYTRAKLVTWVAVAVVAALIAFLMMSTTQLGPSPLDQVRAPAEAVPVMVIAGGPLLALLLLACSAAVSVRLYSRKDL